MGGGGEATDHPVMPTNLLVLSIYKFSANLYQKMIINISFYSFHLSLNLNSYTLNEISINTFYVHSKHM